MTFQELKTKARKEYLPALILERMVPRKIRSRIITSAWTFVLILFVALAAALAFKFPQIQIVYGLLFLAISWWLGVLSLQLFYNSFFYKDIPDARQQLPIVDFDLARILYRSQHKDVVGSFLKTHEGIMIMLRAGISLHDVKGFLHHRTHVLPPEQFSFSGNFITVADYLEVLITVDQEFASFLFGHGLQPRDMRVVAEWVVERTHAKKRKQRWWSRDRLGRVPGLGKNWAYGRIFYLEEYCHELPYVEPEYEAHAVYGSKELEELEAILVKRRGANVLLVNNDKEGSVAIIARLNRMIDDGRVLPELEHMRIAYFDNELFTATLHSKADFETKILQIMHEAEYAGNIILVFDNFSALLSSAEALHSDVVSLLDSYFNSPYLHIVGLVGVDQFHTKIEPNVALMQRFEKIQVETIDESNTIKVLENEIIPVEYESGVFFTYPALVSIAESATRYFPDALMPDRAIDLALEIGPKLQEQGKRIVRTEDVLAVITAKTGIPTGEIHAPEREALLGLEKMLHQRIIGQDEAIAAIAQAVRRARSGINNPNRPMGTFLFLGPTGVGKTETTKVLADVFFGDEAHIERLDMSEFSSADSISKLIGAFEQGKPGILTTMIREHPYGVLLLDEFEKTTPEVMNLFLQILDEGKFSDMTGKKINARNLLIVATSNAGADIIWEGLKAGDDFSQAKDFIIDSVIKSGIFKPELINRFDGVIVFHPLGKHELEKVARLQLEKLQKRLVERGINLIINDELINYVVSFGIDPKFGARPMNRAIQDKVEQAIADKIIRGGLKKGQDISLSLKELTS